MSNESAPTKNASATTSASALTPDEVKKEAARKWRMENSSHLRTYHRKYYSEHRDKIKAAIKEAKEKRDQNSTPKKRGRPRIPIPEEFSDTATTTN